MKRITRNTAMRALGIAALTAVTATTLVGCSSEDEAAAPSASGETPAELQLADVCPSTVSVMMDWKPEVEYGALWNMLGSDYKVDAAAKSTTGSLTVDGYDTGVDLEIRNNIMGQSVPANMAADDSIFIGFVNMDSQLAYKANGQDLTVVVAPLSYSPQIIMWDPETYPDAETIKDVADEGATFVVNSAATYPKLLEDEGILSASQVDGSYTGAPARFVSDPSIAQQGYATAEPYQYKNEIQAWGKDVKYQMLKDVGYDAYTAAWAVRSSDVTAQASCLEKLVPAVQRSAVAFKQDGSWAKKAVVDAVETYNEDWTYSDGLGQYAWETGKEVGIWENSGGAAAGLDMDRVQGVIDKFSTVLRSTGTAVPEDIKTTDIATDQFIDKSITY